MCIPNILQISGNRNWIEFESLLVWHLFQRWAKITFEQKPHPSAIKLDRFSISDGNFSKCCCCYTQRNRVSFSQIDKKLGTIRQNRTPFREINFDQQTGRKKALFGNELINCVICNCAFRLFGMKGIECCGNGKARLIALRSPFNYSLF